MTCIELRREMFKEDLLDSVRDNMKHSGLSWYKHRLQTNHKWTSRQKPCQYGMRFTPKKQCQCYYHLYKATVLLYAPNTHTYILTSKSTLPFLLRYDSLYGVNTTRVVSIAGYVPSNHSSNKIQWQNDKQADACYCDLWDSTAFNQYTH